MALTTTIRVAITDRDAAQELAKQTGQSQMDVVHAALEVYRRQLLLASMNQGFAALRRDPAAWEEEMAEREGWDITIGDAANPDRHCLSHDATNETEQRRDLDRRPEPNARTRDEWATARPRDLGERAQSWSGRIGDGAPRQHRRQENRDTREGAHGRSGANARRIREVRRGAIGIGRPISNRIGVVKATTLAAVMGNVRVLLGL